MIWLIGIVAYLIFGGIAGAVVEGTDDPDPGMLVLVGLFWPALVVLGVLWLVNRWVRLLSRRHQETT